MDFELLGLISKAVPSKDNKRIYLTILTPESSEFNFTVEGQPLANFAPHILQLRKFSGKLTGRVFASDAGSRQVLNVQQMNIKPAA